MRSRLWKVGDHGARMSSSSKNANCRTFCPPPSLWLITDHFNRPSKSYTQPEIRSALQSYIAANKDTLVDPRKQHLIKLDPILASIVLAKDEWINDMKREDILERLIGSMQPFYSIKFPGEKAGKPKYVLVCSAWKNTVH